MRRDITFWSQVRPYSSSAAGAVAGTTAPADNSRDSIKISHTTDSPHKARFALHPNEALAIHAAPITLEWRIPKPRDNMPRDSTPRNGIRANGANSANWRSNIITASTVPQVQPETTEHERANANAHASAHAQYRRPKEKTSIGIACVRRVHSSITSARGRDSSAAPTWQILLVQKRHTYAYNSFVHGQYNPKSTAGMVALFDQMTVDEKHTILSLDYQHIWYRVWLNYIPRASTYFNAKNKFERCFAVDGGKRLRALIESSINAHCLWEIPKGKKKTRAEADIHCAVREFAEETNFTKKHYTLWPRLTKTTRVLDAGCVYIAKYFIALAGHSPTPRLTFRRRDQIGEIAAIEWMSIEDVRRIDYDGALEPLVRSIFNCAKKQLRA